MSSPERVIYRVFDDKLFKFRKTLNLQGGSVPDSKDLPPLIAAIYDAAAEPALWNRFLELLAEAIRGDSTVLVAHDRREWRSNVTRAWRLDPTYQREYNRYYSHHNIWTLRGARYLRAGVVYTGEMACSKREYEQSEFYADYLRRVGAYHGIGGTIANDADTASFVSSIRSSAAGPYSEAESRILESLLPHLRRALQIERRVAAAEQAGSTARGALDCLTDGCLLLDMGGRVIFANRAAEAILSSGDGLGVRNRFLEPAWRGDAERLNTQIQQVLETVGGAGLNAGGAVAVGRPSGKPAYSLLICPVGKALFPLSGSASAAAIFISDPAAAAQPSLLRMYGLTPAEGRIAASLVEGNGLKQAAEALGISLNTAKTHLQRIFGKTGTHRQGELLRVLTARAALQRIG
jgi:DNA-binding CsgD family transcriptional regulator/PAS domain-containing protein